MKKYAITFRKFKKHCNRLDSGTICNELIYKKTNIAQTKCCEKNCPVLKNKQIKEQ